MYALQSNSGSVPAGYNYILHFGAHNNRCTHPRADKFEEEAGGEVQGRGEGLVSMPPAFEFSDFVWVQADQGKLCFILTIVLLNAS